MYTINKNSLLMYLKPCQASRWGLYSLTSFAKKASSQMFRKVLDTPVVICLECLPSVSIEIVVQI